MDIKRRGSQPSSKGPAMFTGTVRIDSPFEGPIRHVPVARVVTFEPGARVGMAYASAGADAHRHVRMWVGAKRWGGPMKEIRPGDVVWFPPGEKHWHGATPTTAMTHIAIQEPLDGKVVEWMEKVSDEQYAGAR